MKMNPHVFGARQQLKILKPIVFLVLVYMMHNFIGAKFAPEMFFHHGPMFVPMIDFPVPICPSGISPGSTRVVFTATTLFGAAERASAVAGGPLARRESAASAGAFIRPSC
jgi:hypothetical protein